MTHPAGYAEPDKSPILHAAIALAPKIAASGEEIEQGRRIPTSIVKALKDAGVFGMAMPHAWGGPELDPLTQFRVLEALALADGTGGFPAHRWYPVRAPHLPQQHSQARPIRNGDSR